MTEEIAALTPEYEDAEAGSETWTNEGRYAGQCNARTKFSYCTRSLEHDGDHIGWAGSAEESERWANVADLAEPAEPASGAVYFRTVTKQQASSDGVTWVDVPEAE